MNKQVEISFEPVARERYAETLQMHLGEQVELWCQVGVVLSVCGTLYAGHGLCPFLVNAHGVEIGIAPHCISKLRMQPSHRLAITVS